MDPASNATDLARLTANIVSAHVTHNRVAPDGLPSLIETVHAALSGLGQASAAADVRPTPAVPAKKSVFPDYIICLEEGSKLKMLKRYLATRYQMTPAQYRERWGLPAEYPMVAPVYSKKRSELARDIGLGRTPKAMLAPETPPPARSKARTRKKPAA